MTASDNKSAVRPFSRGRVARTEILPDESRHRQRDRRDGQEREGIDLKLYDVQPAMQSAPKRVDIGLHKTIGKRRDRQLHADGRPSAQMLPSMFFSQPDRPPLSMR